MNNRHVHLVPPVRLVLVAATRGAVHVMSCLTGRNGNIPTVEMQKLLDLVPTLDGLPFRTRMDIFRRFIDGLDADRGDLRMRFVAHVRRDGKRQVLYGRCRLDRSET